MIGRRSFLHVAVALALSGASLRGADAANAEASKAFVKSLADEAIALMARHDVSAADRTSRFRELFKRGFDVDGIGRFVLGRYWRDASEAERAEYLRLFEDLIVATYASRFTEYSGETLRILDARPDDDRMVLVTSQIDRPSGPPIRLDWRLTESNGRFKITDVVVEAVSMSVTQRSEFSSVIQRGGGRIESLIAALRDKTKGMR